MPESIEKIGDVGGVGTILAFINLKVFSWLGLTDINEFITLLIGLGGLIYLFYKIKSQRISVKSGKLDIKIKEGKLKFWKDENERKKLQ